MNKIFQIKFNWTNINFVFITIVRYLLAYSMIGYGLTKILNTQFVMLPFSIWQTPLEMLSGKNIAWAFLGYSTSFQTLLGFLELVPAILILFNRTSFLGSILLFPVLLNVLLINYALDLWDSTKTISLVLLILNLIIVLSNYTRILKIIKIIFQNVEQVAFQKIEIILGIMIILIAIYMTLPDLLDYRNQRNVLMGDWFNKKPNEWVLQNDSNLTDISTNKLQKIYFGVFGEFSEITENGMSERNKFSYNLDEKVNILTIVNNETNESSKFNYNIQGDSILILRISMATSNGHYLVKTYKKRVVNASKK